MGSVPPFMPPPSLVTGGLKRPPGVSRTSAKPCAVLGRKDQAQPRQARPGVRKSKLLANNRTKNHWNYGKIRRQRLYEALLCSNQKWNYKFFTTSPAVQTQAPWAQAMTHTQRTGIIIKLSQNRRTSYQGGGIFENSSPPLFVNGLLLFCSLSLPTAVSLYFMATDFFLRNAENRW